jgi:hypothetical protein
MYIISFLYGLSSLTLLPFTNLTTTFTFLRYRSHKGEVYFGNYFIHLGRGRISEGDEVKVTKFNMEDIFSFTTTAYVSSTVEDISSMVD